MFILSSELTDFYWRGTKATWINLYDTILIIFAGLPLIKTWQSSAKVYVMHGILLDD